MVGQAQSALAGCCFSGTSREEVEPFLACCRDTGAQGRQPGQCRAGRRLENCQESAPTCVHQQELRSVRLLRSRDEIRASPGACACAGGPVCPDLAVPGENLCLDPPLQGLRTT